MLDLLEVDLKGFDIPFFQNFHREYNLNDAMDVDVPLEVEKRIIDIYENKYNSGFVNKIYLKLFGLIRLSNQLDDVSVALNDYAMDRLVELLNKLEDYINGNKLVEFIGDDYYVIEKSLYAIENYLGLHCNFYFVEAA